MNLRDRVFLSCPISPSTVWFSFGLLPSLPQHLGDLHAKHYVIYTVFLPKRRHSLWGWIPNGHEPQVHESILDKQETHWGWDMMSLFDLISGKISENSIPLGMLLHQALHCAENKWPRAYDDGLEDGLRSCSSWKWIFAPSWAHWPNMQLGTNPNMHLSRKTCYIIETGKGRTRKWKKHFLKLKTVQND